jgi:hypothetical protein
MQSVEHVTIETRPDFMERYVSSMEFPEPAEASSSALAAGSAGAGKIGC